VVVCPSKITKKEEEKKEMIILQDRFLEWVTPMPMAYPKIA